MRRRTLLIRGLTGGLTAAFGAAILARTRGLRAASGADADRPEAIRPGAIRPGAIRPGAIRIVRPVSLAALPLLIMEHEQLIERIAEAMGLDRIAVSWQTPDKETGLDALAAGQADFAVAELAPFLAAADRETAGAAAIRALGAVAQRPYVLVTRNKAVHTICDFGQADRIAVPALKLSGPAVMLDMAAAEEWGIEHADKLAALAVAMPDDSATSALIAGKGAVTAHFSQTPYVDRELAEPAISRVMDSFDIAGPHTGKLLAATLGFRDANSELCKAVLAALQQAGEFIEKNPGRAAEIYAAMTKEDDIAPEELSDMIGDPDLVYAAAPAGVARIAAFMHRTGRLRRRPGDWRDVFLPEARDLPGS